MWLNSPRAAAAAATYCRDLLTPRGVSAPTTLDALTDLVRANAEAQNSALVEGIRLVTTYEELTLYRKRLTKRQLKNRTGRAFFLFAYFHPSSSLSLASHPLPFPLSPTIAAHFGQGDRSVWKLALHPPLLPSAHTNAEPGILLCACGANRTHQKNMSRGGGEPAGPSW